MAFQDHFSRQADQYTQFRPRYPRELFAFLASLLERRERAWDCGCGNGQAAVDLAEWFAEVVATDPSSNQISHAEQNAGVRYLVAAAEDCPLADRSVDLVTVAQALHWFDLPRFYGEVRRVTRPGGVVAAWSYGLAVIDPAVDRVVWHLYSDILGTYWPPERHYIEERYESLPFTFDAIPAPKFDMRTTWSLDQLLGYLGTWSSVARYRQQHEVDPLEQVSASLRAAWGDAHLQREVRWPLIVRVGRVT